MRLSIDSLLSDIEEYFVDNSDPHSYRYKRLDPRGLLGRAYTLIAELDEKVANPLDEDEEECGEYDEEEYDEEEEGEDYEEEEGEDYEEEEDEDEETVDNVDDVK